MKLLENDSLLLDDYNYLTQDGLGEEWYADLLRSSVSTVIGTALNLVKQGIHLAIGDFPSNWSSAEKEEFAEKYDELVEKYGKENVAYDLRNGLIKIYNKQNLFKVVKFYSGRYITLLNDVAANANELDWIQSLQDNPWEERVFDVQLWKNDDDATERYNNFLQWQGARTDLEIKTNVLMEHKKIEAYGQTGDIIFVNGISPFANITKSVTLGPVNHVGMLYVDFTGEKWVLEMFNKGGLHKTRLSDFIHRIVNEKSDIQVGRLDNLSAQEISIMIEQEFFIRGTTQPKFVPYNRSNLFALNGESTDSFICSGFVEYIYRQIGSPIFTKKQRQYSPVDIYYKILEIGKRY